MKIVFIALVCYFAFARDLPLDPLIDQGGSLSHYRCIRQTYEQVAIWFNITTGGIPKNQSQILENAKNAGLKINVAFYSCRTLSVERQFSQIIKAIGQIAVERVFIKPDIEQYTCSWKDFPHSDNCLYLQSLLEMFKQKGLKAGVVSGRTLWNSVFGTDTACPQVKDALFAWLPLQSEQSNQPDFQHYTQIGGWVQPFSKFYLAKNICGRIYFHSFYVQ